MLSRLKVKYFDKEMPKLEVTEKGDWIDLRVVKALVVDNKEFDIKTAIKNKTVDAWNKDNRVYFKAGDVVVCRLGVAIELPIWTKANVYPRSSTFPTWGLFLVNSVGCIDNVYKGDNDEWLAIFYATREGYIEKYDRVCQFTTTDRTMYEIKEVNALESADRGGHGTSGKN